MLRTKDIHISVALNNKHSFLNRGHATATAYCYVHMDTNSTATSVNTSAIIRTIFLLPRLTENVRNDQLFF